MIVFLCASDLVAILLFFSGLLMVLSNFEFSSLCMYMYCTSLSVDEISHCYLCFFFDPFFSELIVWNSVGYGRRILFDCSVLRCKYFYTILNSLSRLTSQQRCDTYHRIRSFCSRFYMNNFFKRSSLIFFSIYLHFYSAIFMVSVFEQ